MEAWEDCERFMPMSNARERNLTQIYLCALFIIQPLLVHKTYLDIVETKREVFYALSALYLFFLFLLVLVRTLRAGKVLFPSLSWQEGFFLLFALCGITSSLLSPYARSAFLGNDNRNQGILAFSLYSMLLLSLRRYGAITPALRRCALLSASMVSILGILNQFHLDPLGFFTIIVSDQLPRFSSTIGNVDFYTAYLLLFFPVPLFLCLQSSTKKARLGYGLLALLFLYGIMAARTECGVLGLLVALSVTPLLCKEEALFRRFFSLLPLLLLAMLLYGTLTTALGGFRLSQLTRAFLSPLPLCLCYGLTLLLAY